jgi:hypothetical protein
MPGCILQMAAVCGIERLVCCLTVVSVWLLHVDKRDGYLFIKNIAFLSAVGR